MFTLLHSRKPRFKLQCYSTFWENCTTLKLAYANDINSTIHRATYQTSTHGAENCWLKVAIGKNIYIFLLQINWFNIILPLGNSCYASHQFSEISNSVPKKPLQKTKERVNVSAGGGGGCEGDGPCPGLKHWNIETKKIRHLRAFLCQLKQLNSWKFWKIVCGGDVNSCDFCLAYLAFWSYNIQKWWHFSRILSILSGVVDDVGLIFSRYWKSWRKIQYKTYYNSTNLIWFFPPYPRSYSQPDALGAVKTPGVHGLVPSNRWHLVAVVVVVGNEENLGEATVQ